MEQLEILKQILNTLRKMNSYGQEDISLAATDYKPSRGFYLYVGVGGTVVGVDSNGKTINRHFIAGYHPFICREITKTGTTATSLAAMFVD